MNYIGIKAFVTVEFFLYLGYLCLDIKGVSDISSYIKFFSILLCFLWITFYSIRLNKNKIIPAALGFSVLSDIFLLFTRHFVLGLIFFLIVQTLIMFELYRGGWIHLKPQIGIRIGVPISILLTFCFFQIPLDGVLILAVIYIVSFAANVLAALRETQKARENMALRLLAVGLFLFFMCDIQVGIFNISSYLQNDSMILQKLTSFASIGMWLFYLPGQVLIGISNLKTKEIGNL